MKTFMFRKSIIPFLTIFSFLLLITIPGYAQSKQSSVIRGKILAADKKSPVSGAIVKAAEIESKKIYESKPTTENGHYEISGLEKGTYDIAVEINNGLYIAKKLLNIGKGESHTLSLALIENPPEENPSNPKQEKEMVPEKFEKKDKKTGLWENPLSAVAGIVGVAVIVAFAIDEMTIEVEKPPSPWR